MNPDAVAFKGSGLDVFVVGAYFIIIVGFGLWFGRYTKSTKDFFLGGQRFAWWIIAFSSIATTVGSYSFVKYSDVGFRYGLSSSQTYLNDWFWIPILLLVWLPIIYFMRIQSVPEYFERRFGPAARFAATLLILLYLVGYVGINLLTLGRTLESLTGGSIPVMTGAIMTAFVVVLYMFAGGQTSVIMTDLAQGIILLIAGVGLFVFGVYHVGGWGSFMSLLPEGHRYAFSEFNAPDKFSFIGIYSQDGLANSGAFVLMNQGMIMRFLSIRSMRDARKMTVFWILILSPIAAIAVSSGGWIAQALMQNGEITTDGDNAFVDAAHYLCAPGVFGFVLAALTAALMSTVDTLVTAVSSIFINDVYRPYLRKDAPDKHYLRVARGSSLVVTIVGLLLVIVFDQFDTIYGAHGMFTAAVTPPMVVAILYGILWKRFTPAAALATLIGGMALVGLSFMWPEATLTPFSFGMGPDSYKFTRALYGLVACGALGGIVTFFTRPSTAAQLRGLVNGAQLEAMAIYKGGTPNRRAGGKKISLVVQIDPGLQDEAIAVPDSALKTMAAEHGDLLYACDPRWWFGGLHSVHVTVAKSSPDDTLYVSPAAMDTAHFVPGQQVVLERLF